MSWTFAGHAFEWLRQNSQGQPIQAGWKTLPRVIKHPLAGTMNAVIAQIGYEPTTIEGPIWFADAALLSLNGASGLLSDGTSSWQVMFELDPAQIAAGGGYVAQATFTQGRVV